MICGRKLERIKIMMPAINTLMVFCEQPFHSFSIMPQTLENTTLSAIRMQNDSVMSVGDSVRKPLPSDSPKNWLYHKAPAKAQYTMLLPQTLRFR